MRSIGRLLQDIGRRFTVGGRSRENLNISPSSDDAETPFGESLPRVIFSLWLQGIEGAPDLVKLNFSRWAQQNPGYELRILDRGMVDDLLSGLNLEIDEIPPQALSDIVRARLLSTHGGVWVDASLLPTAPLDSWLPQLVTRSGFFAFEKPFPDRPISSWFLAASRNSLIVEKWWLRVEGYWSAPRVFYDTIPEDPAGFVETRRDVFPYFWFHYLFQSLIDHDREFAASWEACAKVSADAPHALQFALSDNADLGASEIARLIEGSPVHKLNWRAGLPPAVYAALEGATA